MQMEHIPIEYLKFYERNARTHSDEQIAQLVASIKEFGFTNPVLVDEENVLIAGHGRTTAAASMGMTEVPAVRLIGLSDSQKRALRIADNQLALNAGWDLELLTHELRELEGEEFNLDLVGFEDDFLDDILDGSFLVEETDDEEVEEEPPPEPPDDPVSMAGDIWLLGSHRVMCGDSTSIDAVETLTDGAVIDLLLTDPPYNVGYVGGTDEQLTIQNDNMSSDEFRQFMRDVFSAADSVMRSGAAFYIWHADVEVLNVRLAAADVGWQVRQCLIWNKNSMVLGRQDYQWKHEPCLYGWKSGAAHYWGGDRKQTTVLDFNRPTRNGEHPTMKPVDLIEYQVRNSSKRGENVLDLFGGSGSTLIACDNSGRNAYLMELDPRYVDVIVKRWQEHTGKDAVNQLTGETFEQLELMRTGEAANDDTYEQKMRA